MLVAKSDKLVKRSERTWMERETCVKGETCVEDEIDQMSLTHRGCSRTDLECAETLRLKATHGGLQQRGSERLGMARNISEM